MQRSQRITTSPVSIVETQSSAFTSGIRRIATRPTLKLVLLENLRFGFSGT